MNYNVYYKTQVKAFNIPDIEEGLLYDVIDTYEKERKIFVKGITYDLKDVIEFRVFEYSNTDVKFENFHRYCSQHGHTRNGAILPEPLKTLGKEVTEEYIPNGIKKQNGNQLDYVAQSRIEELREIKRDQFSFDKLIVLLEELNKANSQSMIYAKGMLLRSIIDHIPPIFGYGSFVELSSNYKSPGSSHSFKKSMEILQGFKSAADAMLHSQIRRSESLVTDQQVEFRAQLDILLQEIVMKTKSE